MTTKKAIAAAESEHPSYPNPTISEALCEIHFDLSAATPWKPSLPGELFKQIQNDYPEMEPAFEVGLHLELGPKNFGPSLLPPRQRTRFKHGARPLLLHLSENVFTVNVLPTYPGWSTMRSEVLRAWSQARSVLHPAHITRVGLRYINRMERKKKSETPGDWLKACEFIPAGVLKSKGSFLSRVESHIDDENRLIVTVAEIVLENGTEPRPIVFDIDRIVEKQLPVAGGLLQKEMDRLHEDVWQVFDSAQTPKLAKLLKGALR